MKYNEAISQLANSILINFDEVFIDAEIVTTDSGIRFPAIIQADEWINLSPSDQKETIYIRRNGDDDVLDELKTSSCGKAYRMRSSLRIVYFQDHAKNHNEILSKLMQSVLITGTKLGKIVRDKWRLQKDESSGDYTFGATTAYFAIDIFILWNLISETCEEDFCTELKNPLVKCPAAA